MPRSSSFAALAVLGLASAVYLIAPLDLGVSLSEAYLLLRPDWAGMAVVGGVWILASLGLSWLLTRRLV